MKCLGFNFYRIRIIMSAKCKPLRIGRMIHLLSWSAVCKLKRITFESQLFNRK